MWVGTEQQILFPINCDISPIYMYTIPHHYRPGCLSAVLHHVCRLEYSRLRVRPQAYTLYNASCVQLMTDDVKGIKTPDPMGMWRCLLVTNHSTHRPLPVLGYISRNEYLC